MEPYHRGSALHPGPSGNDDRHNADRSLSARVLLAAVINSRWLIGEPQDRADTISASLATVFMFRAVPVFSPGMRSRVVAMPLG